MTVKELLRELLEIDNLDREIDVRVDFADDSFTDSFGLYQGFSTASVDVNANIIIDMKDYELVPKERLQELEEAEERLSELEG